MYIYHMYLYVGMITNQIPNQSVLVPPAVPYYLLMKQTNECFKQIFSSLDIHTFERSEFKIISIVKFSCSTTKNRAANRVL